MTLEPGHVILVADFLERLSLREQDEVQSQHWNHGETTIFPCPIFARREECVWAYSFQVQSDDMSQDSTWVRYVLFKLLRENIPALLREIGGGTMTRATIFTDNCGEQFKCKFYFGWVAGSGVKIVDNDRDVTRQNVHLEHHYFGACLGKNKSDSEGVG